MNLMIFIMKPYTFTSSILSRTLVINVFSLPSTTSQECSEWLIQATNMCMHVYVSVYVCVCVCVYCHIIVAF